MDALFSPPTGIVGTSSPSAASGTEPSFDDALAVVRKNASSHPSLANSLALSLLDTSNNADFAKSLPESDQKLLSDLVAAIDALKAAPPPSPGTSLAQRAAPLLDAARKWQADADLALPRLVLATRVDSFGVFTAVDPRFEQGKRHTVIIYCEVANFAAKKGDDGWFTTRLAQQETLITEDGLLVWRPNPEDIEDRSMNQRHDFYLVKKLTIPENLAAGKYTLRMSVTDRATNKISMVSIPLEIVPKSN